MSKYLFVYGTLMSHFNNPVAEKLRSESTLIGVATTKGTLYNLGKYPAIVFDSKEKVHGELYELHDEASFKWLDEYEDVPVLYIRRVVKVKCNDVKYKCNVYEYAGHVYQFEKIVTGQFQNLATT
jgi:gamma-glutamylcyclotransferase (GGCT)/AIG2-like uncharacterized protein YtfP